MKRLATRVLQTVFALTARDALPQLPHAGSVFVLAPHPDDETLGCGAVIARLRTAGVRVRIAVVTDGSASTDSCVLSPSKLAATRRREAQEAARLLGVPETDLIFLGYPDQQAGAHIDNIAGDIAAQLWLCNPALVFAPYGDDGHPDHVAVAEAVRRLQRQGKIACPVLSYPMWFWPVRALSHMMHPDRYATHRLIRSDRFVEPKRAAAIAQRSQFENITDEEIWRHLEHAFLEQNLRPYELFFEIPAPPRDTAS